MFASSGGRAPASRDSAIYCGMAGSGQRLVAVPVPVVEAVILEDFAYVPFVNQPVYDDCW